MRKPKKCEAAVELLEMKEWPEDYSAEVKDVILFIKKYKFKDALDEVDRVLNALNNTE